MSTMSSSLDLGLDCTVGRIPKKIIPGALKAIYADVPHSIKLHTKELVDSNWQFFCVDQTRGWCDARHKIIVLPLWIRAKSVEYRTWYIAHELAHAFDKCKHSHGPEFMEWLKRICPAESLHFELEYKPRNAMAAGIRKPGDIDSLDLFDL